MKVLTKLLQKMIYENGLVECKKYGNDLLLPEHILLGIIKTKDGVAYSLLKAYNFNLLTLQETLEKSLPLSNAMSSMIANNAKDCVLSERVSAVLGMAEAEAKLLSNDYIGTEHFLLACLLEENSIMQRYFVAAGLKVDVVRQKIKEIQINFQRKALIAQNAFSTLLTNALLARGQQDQDIDDTQEAQEETKDGKRLSFLLRNTKDLTKLAAQNKLQPVIGRQEELDRIVQILCRKTKNNVVLIGEPGVGKTSIIEGLAQKIVYNTVPRNLLKRKVLLLNLSGLVAGSKLRGDFEEKIKLLLKDIKDAGNVILFIDEIHTMIGAGSPEGTMDAANLLKPALANGELQCIGATTTKEYRKYFEKDAALARRFQYIKIKEPSPEETKEILQGIKDKFEEFHGVSYGPETIDTIVQCSLRYITDRFMPDKAIDVMDEAGALKKIKEDKYPKEFEQLEKSIKQLSLEKEQLVKTQDYEKAAIVRDRAIALKKQLNSFSQYWQAAATNKIKLSVSPQDVRQVVHSITDIPTERLDKDCAKRLLDMEKEIGSCVIGQQEAVKAVSACIRRSRSGVSSSKRPQGSFVFLGPTGVGKTYLAKTLAKFLFGTEDALIRIDMSDYMEKHDASRLVGAPPGYIGYDEGGILTEKVKNMPYSVVLFDEIEKAHTSIHNLLLQILEEGELKDNFGKTVNFRNCIIIMTSNVGAKEIIGSNRVGFSTNEGIASFSEIQQFATAELKKVFTPEILNRIDEVLVFHALNQKQITQIATLQLDELAQRLKSLHLTLDVSSSAKTYLAKNGFDAAMGARPMKRLILKEIEEPLSVCLLKAQVFTSAVVEVTCKKGKLQVALKTFLQNDDASQKYAQGAAPVECVSFNAKN